MRLLSYGFLAIGLFGMLASMTHADNTAKDIITKAIKAHGGKKTLAKLKLRQEKSKDSFDARGQNVISISETLLQLPGRRKQQSESEFGNKQFTSIIVVDGAKAWNHRAGKTREYPAEQMKLMTEGVHREYILTLTPLLEDPGLKLSPLGEIKVNDRPALGVQVAAKGHWDVDLYFDKESGLLVRSGGRTVQPRNQEADLVIVHSHYKETDGLKWPMKAVHYLDGKKTEETEITELKFLPRIDDSVFAKP